MNKELALILSLLPAPATNDIEHLREDNLAPHPIYFTVDGSPAREIVKVDGKEFVADWDGQRLDIYEQEPIYIKLNTIYEKNAYGRYLKDMVAFIFPWVTSLWLWSLIGLLLTGHISLFILSSIVGGFFVIVMSMIIMKK